MLIEKENWKEIRDYVQYRWRTKDLFGLLEKFESDLEMAKGGFTVSEKDKVLYMHLVGKSLMTMYEIITLCEAGFPDGAFALTRILYEQMIHLLFFTVHEKDPGNGYMNYVEDFQTNGEYQLYKYRKEYNECFENEDSKAIDEEFKAIQSKAHLSLPDKGKKPNDYWWTGKTNFNSLRKDAEAAFKQEDDQKLFKKLHLFYTATSRYIHVNAASNTARLGGSRYYDVIDIVPNISGQGFPLYFATTCFLYIMLRACQIFQLDFDYYKPRINEFCIFYDQETYHECKKQRKTTQEDLKSYE